jgi:CubicO group peptidase (beta-lactamase class C family)
MKTRLLLPALLVVSAGLGGASEVQATAEDVAELTADRRETRELKTGDTHVYGVVVEKGQFVLGEAFQSGVDVVVTVTDPEGSAVGTFDSPARGPEYFQFETDKAGVYRVSIAPFEEEEGEYSVRILRMEPLADTPEGKVAQMMAPYGPDGPGGVVAVVRGGEIGFSAGYGLANVEYSVPNSISTPYHMASVSKQFTAFAIVVLSREGKLGLDDDVRKHLPEVPDFGHTITLRHLLNHTSGIRDHWTLWAMSGGRMDDVIRQEDLMRLVARQRDLNFEPGAEFLYSNTGYLLLSEVVTKVGGRPFGEWMKVNVFDPLGMTSTQIYDDHERLVPGRAYSYRYSEDGLSKAVLSYANSGATSLFTTAEDLARWLLNFRTGQVGGQEAIDLLQVPGVLNDEGEGEAAGADSEAVPAELGKALAGTFEIENGPYVTITYEGERLSAQAEGRPKVALLPEGELVFRLDITEADIRIEFEAGPGGGGIRPGDLPSERRDPDEARGRMGAGRRGAGRLRGSLLQPRAGDVLHRGARG